MHEKMIENLESVVHGALLRMNRSIHSERTLVLLIFINIIINVIE